MITNAHNTESGGERLDVQDFRLALLRLRFDIARGAARHVVTPEQIDRALSRIESGSFGVCRSCFLLIPRSELLMRPYVDRCLRCQQRMRVEQC